MNDDPGAPAALLGGDDQFLRGLQLETAAEADRLRIKFSVDFYFYIYLRRLSRFGYFTFGPITIDVRLIGDIVLRSAVRIDPYERRYEDDFVRFSVLVVDELKRSGQSRIDELHFLLAFMRVEEGLPSRVFGELGVTREQVEAYARNVGQAGLSAAPAERLYSPEEAADYLGVHVQTVRAWIRSGRLRASRLAGQRALRIAASDLRSVLEPVEPGELQVLNPSEAVARLYSAGNGGLS
jgi:excisionase family DNA binding protein